MAVNVVIPKLGMSVDEVNLLEWKVGEGDTVEQGDTVLVVETQKTEWNIEAEGSGFLHIVVEAGSKAQIGAVVGIIAETREELETLQKTQKDGGKITTMTEQGSAGGRAEQTEKADAKTTAGRLHITPVARKLAEEHMIDILKIPGTGPGGRITREDVERYIAVIPEEREGQGDRQEALRGKKVRETISLKGMRKTISEHMYRSLSGTAQMTIMGEFDMTEIVRFREGYVKHERAIGFRVTYIDMLVYMISRALFKHHDMNCSFIGNELKIWEDVNVGVAVALGAEGLVVPVVKNADKKSLADISKTVRALVDKVQSGNITPDELSEGTFTITSLGKNGVSLFQTPIINQPESAILATGPIIDKPVVKDGQVAIAPMMPYSLTFDHRVINGFGAEQFLGTLQGFIATPSLLLLSE